MNQAGSKFDKLSKDGRARAAEMAKLAWRPIACWAALSIRPRQSHDTHSVTRVEVFLATTRTRDWYLVTESYDGRVELASLQASEYEAAQAYCFHVRMVDPLRDGRGFTTKQYRTFEEAKRFFACFIRAARRLHEEQEAALRERVRETRAAEDGAKVVADVRSHNPQ